MKRIKAMFAVILVLAMIFTALPFAVEAAVKETAETGTTALKDGVKGNSYTDYISVTGLVGGRTYSINISGTLPSGLAVDRGNLDTYYVYGTPTVHGTFTFTFSLTDTSTGVESNKGTYSIKILNKHTFYLRAYSTVSSKYIEYVRLSTNQPYVQDGQNITVTDGYNLIIAFDKMSALIDFEGYMYNGSSVHGSRTLTVTSNMPDTVDVYVFFKPQITYYAGKYGTGPNISEFPVASDVYMYKDSLMACHTMINLRKEGSYTRPGYKQTGWSLNADGSTNDYPNYRVNEAEKPLTLYPYWQKLNTIDNANITINAPKAGEELSYSASVPAGAHYMIEDYSSATWKNGVFWLNSEGKRLPVGSKAEAGKTYTVYISLLSTNEDDYPFAPSNQITAYVNGQAAKINAYNDSNYWVYYTFTAGSGVLAQPKITAFQNTATGIKMTIGAVIGAEKFRVFIKNGSGWKNLGDTTSNTFTYSTTDSGVKSTFTVRCLNAAGNAFTSSYNTTGWSYTYIAQPKITSLQNVNSGISMAWSSSKGASKYRVFLQNGSSWKKLADVSGTSYVYPTKAGGAKFTFTVRCLNSAGNAFISSYNSTGWAYTFIAAPNAPKLTNTSSGIKVAWSKSSGAPKYRVFRKTGSSGWSNIGDTTALTFVDKSAKNGVKYTYTIRCINSAGTKYYSGYNTTGSTITCKR